MKRRYPRQQLRENSRNEAGGLDFGADIFNKGCGDYKIDECDVAGK